MNSRTSKYVGCVFALAFAVLIPITLAAQVTAAATGRAPWDNAGSKWNIFMGYSYLAPNGTDPRYPEWRSWQYLRPDQLWCDFQRCPLL